MHVNILIFNAFPLLQYTVIRSYSHECMNEHCVPVMLCCDQMRLIVDVMRYAHLCKCMLRTLPQKIINVAK